MRASPTRPRPHSDWITALPVGSSRHRAHALDALEQLEDELANILRGAVIGLRDGTISSDGLGTFKLGHEFVRDELAMRRDYLEPHARDAAPTEATTPRW